MRITAIGGNALVVPLENTAPLSYYTPLSIRRQTIDIYKAPGNVIIGNCKRSQIE